MIYDEPPGLPDDQLERLAELVATKLAGLQAPSARLLTVEDVSTQFQVSKAWVREHAGRLGGFKLGTGERARLRFDAAQVAAVLRPIAGPDTPDPPASSQTPRRRRRPTRLHPVYDG